MAPHQGLSVSSPRRPLSSCLGGDVTSSEHPECGKTFEAPQSCCPEPYRSPRPLQCLGECPRRRTEEPAAPAVRVLGGRPQGLRRGLAGSEKAPLLGSPACGGYGLNSALLTSSFLTFFLVLGSGKSGKTYTVTILLTSWSERRNDFTVTERKHRLTCGLINHAHMCAFLGVGLYGIFPFSRREFEL